MFEPSSTFGAVGQKSFARTGDAHRYVPLPTALPERPLPRPAGRVQLMEERRDPNLSSPGRPIFEDRRQPRRRTIAAIAIAAVLQDDPETIAGDIFFTL